MSQISQKEDVWYLSGHLVIDHITKVLDASQALTMPKVLKLDLAQVQEVDTSAISLILEIKRRAAAQETKVQVINPPNNYTSLMQLYGVDSFLT